MRWENKKPRKRAGHAPAAFINPCLPTKVDRPPVGDGWAHEIKHDGYRVQIHVGGDGVRIYTFTGADWTKRYDLIAGAAAKIKGTAIIDAEAAVPGDAGVTDFHALHEERRTAQAVAYAFDIMMLNGEDLRRLPWLERRNKLKRLLGRRSLGLAYNDHFIGSGQDIYEAACRMGLEGIVSKRIDAPYKSGSSKTWLKVKNPEAPGSKRFKEA